MQDGRIPIRPGNNGIAFIINSTEATEEFINTDAYSKNNDDNEIIRSFLNTKDTVVVQKYLSDENRGKVAAIPVGIPSSCFSGILIGDAILQDKEKIAELIKLFPQCYIISRDGQIIYEPKIEEKDEKENYELKIKNAQLSIENDKLRNENQRLQELLTDKSRAYEELMKIVDENCPPENLAQIYYALGWNQGLPLWLSKKLEEKKQEQVNMKEIIEEKDEQIVKLQGMLSTVLEFVSRVRNSVFGKIFFRKEIKKLPSGKGHEAKD